MGIVVIAVLFTAILVGEAGQTNVPDWKKVEMAMGRPGEMLPGGVFKISLPRSEPPVTVDGIRLSPGMIFDSWVSFVRMGDGAMMMGDIVLTVDELGPVQSRLSEEGIDITAVHNTLIGETPQAYDLHISSRGDPVNIAEKIRDALSLTGTSFTGRVGEPRDIPAQEAEHLDAIMGKKGTAEGGIYQYSIPRSETITMDGMAIPPTMDVATLIKFQPLGNGTAAITGDFILRSAEVRPVFRALNENGIVVTALHTHMLTEEPRLFMLHFWASGNESSLARGLRLALNNTNSV